MDFDGFFHRAKLESDQFVWHSARDQSHHFAFTRSQFFHAPLNVFNFFPFGTSAVSASDCLFDSAQKICGLNGLGQEIHGASFHRFYGHRDIAVAGHENDRQHKVRILHFALEIQPTKARHPHVEHETSEAFTVAAAVEELACRSEGVDLITGRFDQPRQCSPNGGIVIDDKDRRGSCGFFGFDSHGSTFSSVRFRG